MRPVIRSLPLEGSGFSPQSLSSPTFAWMHGDFSLRGFGEAWRFDPGVGKGRFSRARHAWENWLSGAQVDDRVGETGAGPVGFASFTFDPQAPGSVVAVPQIVVGRNGAQGWITTAGDADPRFEAVLPTEDSPDRPRYLGPTSPDWQWMDSVARALALIEAGHLKKVVMARDVKVWSKSPFDVKLLLERLHRAFPECFTFLVAGLVGASPELLLRQDKGTVESVALAGTAPRHADPVRDERLARGLLASEKNRHEHELTVESVEDGLARVCSQLSRDAVPTLRELGDLRHLSTAFAGVLAEPTSCFDVLEHLHPTAAVGGVSRRAALDAIRQLEGMERAGYAGPVGWFDQHGDGEWAIALRCAELMDTGARLFAGAGIVAGSLPEEELAETRLKLRAMTDALDLR
ncbi:MAG: isochorismate synthase [bacterium]|nr:isochorismate synthase [Acidimicrobiia bacterium]MCY4649542.1 isochorismate synthase [bacterium]